MNRLLWLNVLGGALLFTAVAHADPPSSVLQAVTIQTASGTLIGFTDFSNIEWYIHQQRAGVQLDNSQQAIPNKKEILILLNAHARLRFFSNLQKIIFPKEMIVTTHPEIMLKRGEIKGIKLRENPLNGFQWYGLVNRVTDKEAELLKTKPVFMCSVARDGCCEHSFWLSYTRDVGETQLKRLCSGPFAPQSEYQDLESTMKQTHGVFRIDESTD